MAFTSSRAGYTDCSVVKNYAEPAAPPAPAVAAGAPQPATGRVEFRTSPGDVAPAAPAGSGKAKVTTKNGAGVCYAWNVNKPGCTCERGGACNFSHVCCLCGSDQHRACDCDAVTSG